MLCYFLYFVLSNSPGADVHLYTFLSLLSPLGYSASLHYRTHASIWHSVSIVSHPSQPIAWSPSFSISLTTIHYDLKTTSELIISSTDFFGDLPCESQILFMACLYWRLCAKSYFPMAFLAVPLLHCFQTSLFCSLSLPFLILQLKCQIFQEALVR